MSPDAPDDGSGPNIGGTSGGYTSRPIPDPTVLTTQALYREVAGLKELIEERIEAAASFNSMRAKELDGEIARIVAARTAIDAEVERRTELQFQLVERQRVEQKKDTKDAVDAALTAQKEAVKEQTTASERAIAKSEAATNKQLEELAKRFETAFDTLRRNVDDVKERATDSERVLRTAIAEVDRKASDTASQKLGATDTRAIGFAIFGAAIGLAGVIWAIVSGGG